MLHGMFILAMILTVSHQLNRSNLLRYGYNISYDKTKPGSPSGKIRHI